jgi:type IV secretory pathway VirB10-like protein
MLDFTNVALRTLMCLAFLIWVVRPMLMSMVRREPNYLELEEMAQLAVNSAYRQQFASFYVPRLPDKAPTPVVEEVIKEELTPVILPTAAELEERAQQELAMANRYKGHEAELARRARVAQEEAERLAREAQALADLEAGVDEDEGDDELKKMRESMKKEKKKPAIPAELLAGNSYEDKLMVVRFVAEQEQNRVANTIRSMIQI